MKTGYLYPLNDSHEGARCVNRLLDVENRIKLGSEGQKEFKANFRAELMVQRTAEVYEKLLSE